MTAWREGDAPSDFWAEPVGSANLALIRDLAPRPSRKIDNRHGDRPDLEL